MRLLLSRLIALVSCLVSGVAVGLMLLTVSAAHARQSNRKGNLVTNHAQGTFDVKVTSAADGNAAGSAIGRFLLDKQYHGDLEGTSRGEMLGANTSVKGSAGYVAMEEVTGTLKGRKGSFILQHSGTMMRGVPEMTVSVVPDSGAGQLTGIAGTMKITIADGKHSYDFEYTLPQTQ
jgi:hypothetical protein